jgi:hypothetical protein
MNQTLIKKNPDEFIQIHRERFIKYPCAYVTNIKLL